MHRDSVDNVIETQAATVGPTEPLGGPQSEKSEIAEAPGLTVGTEKTAEARDAASAPVSPPSAQARWLTWRLCWVLLLPMLLVAVSSDFRAARGPYWLGLNSDPDYAYLFNSLRIVNGRPPFHRDHPGTPLQEIGAQVVQALHPGLDSFDLTTTVLRDPEAHLDAIRLTLGWFYVFVLVASGVIAFYKTGSLLTAFCLQATPLLLATAIDELPRVRPEALELSLTALLVVVAFLQIHGSSKRHSAAYAVSYGVLVGLCLASKVTAAPLLVVPLVLLPNGRSRLCFLAVAVASFAIGILPILPHARALWQWVWANLTHQGKYGTGEPGLVDAAMFLRASRIFIRREPALALVLTASLWACVRDFIDKRRSAGANPYRIGQRALLALVLAQMLQWAMAAKAPAYHYLIPSAGFLGLSLALLLARARQQAWPRTREGRAVLVTVVVAGLLLQLSSFLTLRQETIIHRDRQLEGQRRVLTRYQRWTKVYGHRSSAIEHAVYFGDMFSGEYFYSWLRRLYPDPKIIYCNVYNQTFRSSHGLIRRDQLMRKHRKILFRGGEFVPGVMAGFKLRNVHPGELESLFEWRAGR